MGLDEPVILADRRGTTTLRRLAAEGRLILRRSGSYSAAGASEPRKAMWADVVSSSDPNATEGFEISQAAYDELRAMGVAAEVIADLPVNIESSAAFDRTDTPLPLRAEALTVPYPSALTVASALPVFAPTTEQRPAAYRFTVRNGKLDVLPEPPAPEDRPFAVDTYDELVLKVREFLDKLERSNSARRACESMHRMLSALGTNFNDLRPGVLLSRFRSVEADRATFDTEEARAELFADAFAMMDDVLQTARDLMAAFPIVRQIEAEQLALALDRNPGSVPVIDQRSEEIRAAAEQSGAATEQAIQALAQNDPAIRSALDPLLRTRLVADKLLVVGNFARAVVNKAWAEINELGAASWDALKRELPTGVGIAARVGPLMTLTFLIAGPVGGLAAAAPALGPLAGVFKKIIGDSTKATRRKGAQARPLDARIRKSRAALEKLVLDEARKLPSCAYVDVVRIEAIGTAGSWNIAAWGSIGHRMEVHENIACGEALKVIHASLAERYSLTPPRKRH